ncbi:PLP-dependent aminotransferase family protein [Novosphingobium sp. BL-8H]|uniref:aminotransferase-like domain-containing protein n=1 Tax=Novosphingobium sp. BL-8H TaxID=3127640 RepID=UPI00375726BD
MQTTSQSWLPDIGQAHGPVYLAICAAIGRDLDEGRLNPGDRLPPQRELAEALGIDTGTVTRAYAEARRQGLIDAEGRRGSFVRGLPRKATAQVPPFDTGMNLPPIPADGTFSARFAATLQTVLEGPSAANRLQYQPAGGAPEDRLAGAQWLSAQGIAADEDNVVVTSGAQTALHAIASSILERGDAVCTGPFVYPGWTAICRRLGIKLIPIAADRSGIDPDALEQACSLGTIRAVYIVPDNDNPTTATLDRERRERIVDIARRHDVLIIEDDPYSRLAETEIPPLAAMAPERTWHVASLSKLISPALRIAYLRAPLLRDALRLATDTHETTVMPPPLNLAACARWLNEGTWAELVDEVRAECLTRQAIVRDVLPAGSYRAAPAGYHLWIPLEGETRAFELVSAMRALGVSAVSSEQFRVDPAVQEHAVRLSIGGSVDHQRLRRALEVTEAMLHHRGGRASPLV